MVLDIAGGEYAGHAGGRGKALAAAAGDAEETRRVAAEARDLLERAKATVLANRAHMAVDLGRMHQAAAYRSRGAASSSTWRLEG